MATTQGTLSAREHLGLLERQHARHAKRLHIRGVILGDDPAWKARDRLICAIKRRLSGPIRSYAELYPTCGYNGCDEAPDEGGALCYRHGMDEGDRLGLVSAF